MVYRASGTVGQEAYFFAQDAFGNALATGNFSGTTWSAARTAGITEHQTGKWIDPFTGYYFYHARWYDSGVGRFVGRDMFLQEARSGDNICIACKQQKPTDRLARELTLQVLVEGLNPYVFAFNTPFRYIDIDGSFPELVINGMLPDRIYDIGEFLASLTSDVCSGVYNGCAGSAKFLIRTAEDCCCIWGGLQSIKDCLDRGEEIRGNPRLTPEERWQRRNECFINASRACSETANEINEDVWDTITGGSFISPGVGGTIKFPYSKKINKCPLPKVR